MIVDFIVQIAVLFFNFVIGLMPNFSGLPTGITQSFTFFQTYWDKASLIFPMDTLFQVLALMITVGIGVFAWRMWWFTYHKIPGKFT